MPVTNNNLNAILVGTGEFSFCDGATTVAQASAKGFLDFGNITAFGLTSATDKQEHEGSYRGLKTIDKTFVTKTQIGYKLTCDEWEANKLQFLFFGTRGDATTQAALEADDADPLAFSVQNPAAVELWYDLRIDGKRVRNLTTVTIAAKVEGTDFVVDKLLGRVKFLTAQTAALTPALTAPAIAVGDAHSFHTITPLTNARRSGIGRLVCFDDSDTNRVIFEHDGFSCDVFLESAPGSVDGKKAADFSLQVQVTTLPGTVFSRE